MSGPRSSATAPSSPMQPNPDPPLNSPGQILPNRTISGHATPNHRMRSIQQSRGQSPGQAQTPTHSAPTRMPHRTPTACSPANPSPGRVHRQEFSLRLQAWLAEQAPAAAAALAASHSDQPGCKSAGAAGRAAAGSADGATASDEGLGAAAGSAAKATAAAAHAASHDKRLVTNPCSNHVEGSNAAVDSKLRQDGDMRMQMGCQDWPDVPEMEMPPVPTPRTMGQFPPPQTPFAMTPMSGAAAAVTENPAALSTARASASVANARRLSFGGGRYLYT